MPASIRSSDLFSGSDWSVLYQAFTKVNFNASDPATINAALRSYIQQTYPENYNDWIESSEFVAIIDLLSYLAGTLAFRTDINVRENFLDIAESRESIIRLARFLSYQPRRCLPSFYVVKIIEVSTDGNVVDDYGNSLANQTIMWNDPDNIDWYEQFLAVLNDALITNNSFGQPLRSGMVSSINTQSYRFNCINSEQDFSFKTSVGGNQMSFEIADGDFVDGGGFFERDPNPNGAFQFYYRNDGNGYDSIATGFFLLFKEGTTNSESFNISPPVENLVLDMGATNVNEIDVWVQSLDSNNNITSTWTKVPAIFNQNITYNTQPTSIQDIFSVITRLNDQISIRFSDGRFGTAPSGWIKCTYRTSNGLAYSISPQDMSRITVPITYYDSQNNSHTLTLTFSLQETVANSAIAETDAQIKMNAPSVYGTQNRMVSGNDYNLFPLQGTTALKIKAINRVYSGHSRYINLHEPTGNYQDTDVFADDGMFYIEPRDYYAAVPTTMNYTPEELLTLYIQPNLETQEAKQFMTFGLIGEMKGGYVPVVSGTTWTQIADAAFASTGYFSTTNDFLIPGANLQFNVNGKLIWAAIDALTGPVNFQTPVGMAGPVSLSIPVPTGAVLVAIIPAYAPILSSTVQSTIIDKITNNDSFSLWFDYVASSWTVGAPTSYSTNPHTIGSHQFLVMTVDYLSGGVWRFQSHGLRYVFESQQKVEWYFDGGKGIDEATGLQKSDIIRILKYNEDLTTGVGLGRSYDLSIDKMYYYSDGYADPSRISVNFVDNNSDGYPDDPDTFIRLVLPMTDPRSILFWQQNLSGTTAAGVLTPISTMIAYALEADLKSSVPTVNPTVAFAADTQQFWEYTGTWATITGYTFAQGRGFNVAASWYPAGVSTPIVVETNPINFQWKHYAPLDYRIDPACTNIIDIFVLTTTYDTAVRQWISNGADITTMPAAPSELELRLAFQSYESYKMFSDSIVWRPVNYKFLFGNGADPELRAQFKVVALPNSPYSDGEIRSRVITAINTYFGAQYWDFGETFYFTELAAWIHQQLAGVISSVVLVPMAPDTYFGDGFEITSRSDELFISTAQVSDVIIISSNTTSNLRIG